LFLLDYNFWTTTT